MRFYRIMMIVFTIVAVCPLIVLAEEKSSVRVAEKADSFAVLNKELDGARKAWMKERAAAYAQARANGKDKGFKFDKPFPSASFSPRFLAIAERNPVGAEAIDALKMTLQTSNGTEPGIALETRARAISVLREHYLTKPSIKGFLSILVPYEDADSKALVAEVIARNPDRKLQAAVYKEQIAYCQAVTRLIDYVKDPKRLETIEKYHGKDGVKAQLVKAEKAKAELERLRDTLRDNYSDLYNALSIGDVAPEVEMQTFDGKPTRLSSLKGKVVVLDIWATWCGPCKAMIPHEREMVARLKGKPFELVGISIDSEVKPLQEFLAKETLPWTHWWAGPGGWESGIAEAWDIRSIPAIFVLDAKGVIRYKNLRGEELEKAVNGLLEEQSKAVAGTKSQ
jgi:thiol-disulfide isomerase/thioredoxin